jgi:REP element-mobilizing transposase RayT
MDLRPHTRRSTFHKFHTKKRIELTEIGKIIENEWNEIPNQFDTVSLDEFIVMPNHVH